MKQQIDPASFRDPSGNVFISRERLRRRVNLIYKNDYDLLYKSGLYDQLIIHNLLIPHVEIKRSHRGGDVYKIIEPKRVPFISYPYEWCFSQLRLAALTTLNIQKRALESGMSLKDASSFNIQFIDGRPILIDTLSFESLKSKKPWVAYRQFCEQFLNPLLLMSHCEARLGKLIAVYPDGISTELVRKLLPTATKLNPGILAHVVFHERQQRSSVNTNLISKLNFSLLSHKGLVESLQSLIAKLPVPKTQSFWKEYRQQTYYQETVENKQKIVVEWLIRLKPAEVWDLGANTGFFSRLAANRLIFTLAIDSDHDAVETNYQQVLSEKEKHVLPLWIDLVNPTPGVGWMNRERKSFIDRGPADLVLALALLHHLAIGHNLPFSHLANFFAQLSQWLLIEFIPKTDPQVSQMLKWRKDIFANYTEVTFMKDFTKRFRIEKVIKLKNSQRSIFIMRRLKV